MSSTEGDIHDDTITMDDKPSQCSTSSDLSNKRTTFRKECAEIAKEVSSQSLFMRRELTALLQTISEPGGFSQRSETILKGLYRCMAALRSLRENQEEQKKDLDWTDQSGESGMSPESAVASTDAETELKNIQDILNDLETKIEDKNLIATLIGLENWSDSYRRYLGV